jgi:diguanylate cyclase (GGDEF)-like protein
MTADSAEPDSTLARTNRILRTLRAGHRALLRASDEQALLRTMCDVLAGEGGYAIVWIGYAGHDAAKTIRPVAHAGEGGRFLAHLQLSWDGSQPSVSGEAIRTGSACVGRRLRSDPLLTRWRADAERLGYGAVSAFPLRVDDAAVGCLTLVAVAEDAFDATEVALRAAMRPTLASAIEGARNEHSAFAVLSIHVTHFDEISDTLGHAAGDRLLADVARRVRDIASPGDGRLARIGEDELLLLLPGADAEQAGHLARRIAAALYRPMAFEGAQLDARGAIGIALHPGHGDEPDELMRRAKVAMYSAGAGGYAVYSGLRDDERRHRLALIADLRRAIDADELSLYCQPKVEMASRRLCGGEALMRWHHPAGRHDLAVAFRRTCRACGIDHAVDALAARGGFP